MTGAFAVFRYYFRCLNRKSVNPELCWYIHYPRLFFKSLPHPEQGFLPFYREAGLYGYTLRPTGIARISERRTCRKIAQLCLPLQV